MTTVTITTTPEIEIAGKLTAAALGRAFLEATQRAREADRCTNVTSGGVIIATVVPYLVGDARDIYTLLGPPGQHPAEITAIHPPGTQLELEAGDEPPA